MPTPRNKPSDPKDLCGYEVLVAVSGGIAAYKVCEVVSRFVQGGAGVTVAMTRAARKFVGPVTFQALTGRRTLTNLWNPDEAARVEHIMATGLADLILIAPATANLIGKLAAGIADDLVTTMLLGAASPILMAPSMNDRMWANPLVQRNVAALKESGVRLVGPADGWMACRSVGLGRLADPVEIVEAAVTMLKTSPPKGTIARVD